MSICFLKRSATAAITLFLICSVASPTASAAEDSTALTNAHIAKRLDPTDFRSRIEFRNRLQEPQSGGIRNISFARLEYAFSKQWLVRVETPVMVYDAEQPGSVTQGGMGDLLVRANVRLLRTEHVALVAGAEFLLDTASDRALGSGHHSGGPIAFLSIESHDLHTTFFPLVQHIESFAGDSTRREVNYTLTRLFALTRWPERFYTGTELSVYYDHERDQEGATLELEVGRFITPHIAVWTRPGIGNWGDRIPQVFNWDLEFGLRYLFD